MSYITPKRGTSIDSKGSVLEFGENTEVYTMNVVGNMVGASRNLNPLNKISAPTGWKHIDTKFGLAAHEAEAHRRVLQIAHGTVVKKLLANFHLNEWHYHAKVVTGRILKKQR